MLVVLNSYHIFNYMYTDSLIYMKIFKYIGWY